MLHAAGLLHEQSRADRDNYIKMMYENLGYKPGEGGINMAKFSTYDYNPYDYESVMQYSLWVRIDLIVEWEPRI